jgi:3-aminobutyryl-CoA ammonia-lyase
MDRTHSGEHSPGPATPAADAAPRSNGSPGSEGAHAARTEADPAASVTHRRYVPYSHAHYAGNLVDGAYVLALFGDVATELMIRLDGDEGLFAAYSEVQFLAPVRGGDVIEVTATLVDRGRRSRRIRFRAHVVCRAAPERGPSASEVLTVPLLVTSAEGTVVAPA